MIYPGLVSVTFRNLSPERVVEVAAASGLAGIEWGGDIHVPHGDLAAARAVARLTHDAGLEVSAYGSYYRLGGSGQAPAQRPFEAVLHTALALGAPLVRVWAGTVPSLEAGPAYIERVIDDACEACILSSAAGVSVATEYHTGTLTDTPDSALRLLSSVPGLLTYWQPPLVALAGRGTAATGQPPQVPEGSSFTESQRGLLTVLGRLGNVHVFHWGPAGERLSLAEGAAEWLEYLSAIATAGAGIGTGPASAIDGRLANSSLGEHERAGVSAPRPLWASLEFVRRDSTDQLREDAATLIGLLNAVARPDTP